MRHFYSTSLFSLTFLFFLPSKQALVCTQSSLESERKEEQDDSRNAKSTNRTYWWCKIYGYHQLGPSRKMLTATGTGIKGRLHNSLRHSAGPYSRDKQKISSLSLLIGQESNIMRVEAIKPKYHSVISDKNEIQMSKHW